MKNDCRKAKLHFQVTFSLPSTSCLLKLPNACPRGQVSQSEAMLRLKATSGPKSQGASSRYSALATRPEVPSLRPSLFFPTGACELGSSPHCTKVYCSLPHAFTFENVCCLAKEMTSPQYKCLLSLPLLLNFVFTVVAFSLLNYSLRRNGTRFCEWLPLSGFLVMRMRTFHLLVDTIRSELGLPMITPQLTIKKAAQAKHQLFQNIVSTIFF